MRNATTFSSPLTLEELAIRFGPIVLQGALSKNEFTALVSRCPDLPMERERNGFVTITSPLKRGSSRREVNLLFRLMQWNEQLVLPGEVHGASGGFDLPDGATKSPDVAWIAPEKLSLLEQEEEDVFIPLVPDFVAEIRSHTDRLKTLQHKMVHTWLTNGVKLAWLIDPYAEKVWIYSEGENAPTVVEDFATNTLSGESVLQGFILPLSCLKRR